MPVRTRAIVAEKDIYITAEGQQYLLHNPRNRAVLSDTGSGMPEIEYITQRGPYQHGESVKDYFLRPRVVEFHIRQNFCSRQAYFDGRDMILDLLRPNRGSGVLRKIRPDGAKRDLVVHIQAGPKFESRKSSEWDEWSLDEVLRFIAYNPIYYDPDSYSQTFTTSGALVFPITFPIIFAGFGNTATVVYDGNWIEYPVIILTGPLSATSILNLTTGERIGFTYNIPATRTVTIDLNYGSKRIFLDDGTNLIGYITPTSDLATFHLEPGENIIQVAGVGSDANTTLSINYMNRYIGI